MRARNAFIATVLVVFVLIAVRTAAQAPAPPAPSGGQGGRGLQPTFPPTFPEQLRPPGDPALIARGKTLYEVYCSRCHGSDLRGGDLGGPNLLRSQIVMNDQEGETIEPILRSGRPNTSSPANPPMPPMAMPKEDVQAIAAYLHSVTRLITLKGVPAPGAEFGVFDRLVGDATAGRAAFAAKCSACHSATGDLRGLGTRMSEVMQLQNYWVAGGAAAGRGGGGQGAGGAARTVTVTSPSGQKTEGRLVHADDFVVTLVDAGGSVVSIARNGDTPKVQITDPRAPHKKLLPTYTDKEIHDITAYLVTLK